MGFLKRFFSIGSRRKKNKRTLAGSPSNANDPALERILEEEQEAAASRLLRSSSARFTVVSEVDYTNLPPMPHPINHIVQTPAESSTTLSNTAQRSTFSVTIHRRTRHALTEFPNANPPMPNGAETEAESPQPKREYTIPLARPHDSIRCRSKSTPFPMTPRDANRLQRLRQDPSVASLVNLYDEHGCLPPSAFSNTPPSLPKERAQVRRNGSTLRQLLGDPKPRTDGEDNSGLEGVISWAERFLGETDANSSTSSLGQCLRTPTEFDIPSMHDHQEHKNDNMTFSTDHDLSGVNDTDISANYPTFSSLEVEVSMVTDSPPLSASHYPTCRHENSMTPRRASQVFGFLTERRQSRMLQEEQLENVSKLPIPLLKSAFESPSKSRFSDNSIEYEDQEQSLVDTPLHDAQADSPSGAASIRLSHISSCDRPDSASLSSDNNNVDENFPSRSLPKYQNNMLHLGELDSTVPKQLDDHNTQRSAAATTLNSERNETTQSQALHDRSKRVLNGPRPRPSQRYTEPTNSSDKESTNECPIRVVRHALVDKPPQANNYDVPSRKDPFTPIPPRRSKSHQRTASTSTLSLEQDFEISERCQATPLPPAGAAEKQALRDWPRLRGGIEKENGVARLLPMTPVRSYLRTPVGMPPSPASSSELSPVGRQMMTNLREQRMRGREAEKQRRIRLSTGVGERYGW